MKSRLVFYLIVALMLCTGTGIVTCFSGCSNGAPAPPGSPVVKSVSSRTVELSWIDNSHNELGFKVYRGTDLIGTLPENTTIFTDSSLQPGSEYLYYIKSYNRSGESVAVNRTVTTLGPPAAPVNLHAADSTAGSITLSWNNSTNAQIGFKLYRDGVVIAEPVPDADSFLDLDLRAATSYTYTLIAFNRYGNSEPVSAVLSTPNIPLVIHLNSMRVITKIILDQKRSGQLYLIAGVIDGNTTVSKRLPEDQTTTYTIETEKLVPIDIVLYSTPEVSENLTLLIQVYQSDGDIFEQMEVKFLDIIIPGYTGEIPGSGEHLNTTNLADISNGILGDPDDFIGSYEFHGNKLNDYGTGDHDETIYCDNQSNSCLTLQFRISSD